MIAALDANIVIYLIEANPIWTSKAVARVTTIRAGGDEIAFCDAGRLECLIKPLASGNATDVSTYRGFFGSPLEGIIHPRPRCGHPTPMSDQITP
jgi:hypothetical protein